MCESYLNIEQDHIYIRHNRICTDRPTLLFIHGLGDSGLCFQEVFECKWSGDFNILIPDLIGYGRSSASASGHYSLDAHAESLWKIIDHFELSELMIVGHSMGGDIATLLCASDKRKIIKKYINIEGNITQHDLFISNRTAEAAKNRDFDKWFAEEFMDASVYERWGNKLKSNRRYYASLKFCRPEAFLANSKEMVARNTSLPGKYKSETGKIYCSLTLPTVFCYGTLSLSPGTVEFIKENNLPHRAFEGAPHMLMIEKKDEFYSFLYDFIRKTYM